LESKLYYESSSKAVNDICLNVCHVSKLIGVETRRLLGDSDRGTKAKTITSCDNAFVTNILLAQAAHRTHPGSFALCESVATATTKRPVGTEINDTSWWLY